MSDQRKPRMAFAVSLLFTLGAVGGIAWWISRDSQEIFEAVGNVPFLALAGSAVMIVLGSLCAMLAWRELCLVPEARVQPVTAGSFFFRTQLGKYLPGGLWPVLAQSYLAASLGTSRTRVIAAFSLNLVISLVTGTVLAAGVLPVAWPELWWIPVAAGALLLTLVGFPGRIFFLLSRMPRFKRLSSLESTDMPSRIRRSSGYAVLGWIMNGLHVYLLVVALGGDPFSSAYPAVASLALATVVGSLAVFFPGGIGPRELALVTVLGLVVTHANALAIAVVSRLLTTVVELALAAVFQRTEKDTDKRRNESNVVPQV